MLLCGGTGVLVYRHGNKEESGVIDKRMLAGLFEHETTDG